MLLHGTIESVSMGTVVFLYGYKGPLVYDVNSCTNSYKCQLNSWPRSDELFQPH